ncbi:hypothetical protein AA0N74_07910 [Chromobacterium vaccinii]|uniref:hypothetical protein n=1 Tax=Chromobacterium vaccinii TaxID=1108595 RepID=UPI0031D92A0A
MIGVFLCPAMYIAHETGLSLEEAQKGLARLGEMGFCTYDDEQELVWVHEMARFQVGEALKPADKRCAGVRKEFDKIANPQIKQAFFSRYRGAFHLGSQAPSQAPSRELASQEQEQEQEQEQKNSGGGSKQSTHSRAEPPPPVVDGDSERLRRQASLLQQLGVRADPIKLAAYPALALASDGDIRLAVQALIDRGERDFNAGLVVRKLNDLNACRDRSDKAGVSFDPPWYTTATGIEAKAREIGFEIPKDTPLGVWKFDLFKRTGVTREMHEKWSR